MRIKKDLGVLGETIAADYLEKNGYKVIARNYANVRGEIDIIAQEKDVLVFVEVRTRSGSQAHEYNLSSIDAKKQHQLSKMAVYFLQQNDRFEKKARFDVVSVALSDPTQKIRLIKNAFDLSIKYQL
ncbi:MAG: YraN family protein [Candidatus Omnitrophota bacterium]